MERVLTLAVRFMAARYHGEPEWPPSPARLFQALVASNARAGGLSEFHTLALRWLEDQPPPIIAAPYAWKTAELKLFVPNNDLDAKGGSPAEVGALRVGKSVRGRVIAEHLPLLYVWRVDEDDEALANRVCEMALELYQLGRGVDMAWAVGAVEAEEELQARLANYPGQIHRPTVGTSGGLSLSCPDPGSLASLQARYSATLERFSVEGTGKSRIEVFRQPPKARFTPIAYDSPPARRLYDLRVISGDEAKGPIAGGFRQSAQTLTVALTECLRDAATERLKDVFPELEGDLERGLIGRPVEGLPKVPSEQRVRILPLPSIGHEKTDPSIRRVLVEVPSGNPLRCADVFWAFSKLIVKNMLVVPAEQTRMLGHYGIADEKERANQRAARRWYTVTPLALPAPRRRIDPAREASDRSEAKGGEERQEEEGRACAAVFQALRHAGLDVRPAHIHVQREPYMGKGESAEAFARKPRFTKERLWHVALEFPTPVAGPLVLGDGRFCGLGLMAPAREGQVDALEPVTVGRSRPLAFQVIDGLGEGADPLAVAAALRRAVLARYQAQIGARKRIPAYVSGHGEDGSSSKDGHHLIYMFDPARSRLLILPPTVRSHDDSSGWRAHVLQTLHAAMHGFSELRAGRAGRLIVTPAAITDRDPLFACSKIWRSLTPYTVNRHHRAADAHKAVCQDLEVTFRQAGLPIPEIEIQSCRGEAGVGLTATIELCFPRAVPGPIVLGRTRFKGGGVFEARPRERV